MSLSLKNVSIRELDVRSLSAEDERFHTVTARAVAKPEMVWNWVSKLLAEKGRLIVQSMKPLDIKVRGGTQISQERVPVGYVIQLEKITE